MNKNIFREYSMRIDNYFYKRDEDNGFKLLNRALKESTTFPSWNAFFKGEYEGYKNKDYKAQEKHFFDALNLDCNELFFLRGMGVNLSLQRRYEESLAWYEKALAINPDDVTTHRERGAALTMLGKEREAIADFDKGLMHVPTDPQLLCWKSSSLAKLGFVEESMSLFDIVLKLNPNDVVAVRTRGVVLSRLGKESDAIDWFNKALLIDKKDAITWRCKGISLLNQQKYTEAMEMFSRAIEISPTDKDAKQYFELANRLGARGSTSSTNEKIELPTKKNHNEQVNLPKQQEQINFFEVLSSVWQTTGSMEEFLVKSKMEQKRLDSFICDEGSFDTSRGFLLGLRKWNSYTPALPSKNRTFGTVDTSDRSIGGGYYLYYKGEGIVIDPGFNFIENFNTLGGTLSDIKHIIITHAHNDHTADLESILSLFYRRNNDEKAGITGGPNLYLNVGAFQKFSPILNLHSSKHLGRIRVIAADEEYKFGELNLRILPAYHDEVLTRDYSIGLLFTFSNTKFLPSDKDHEEMTQQKSILFTSDTGFVPKPLDKEQAGKLSNGNVLDIATRYGILRPDFLVPHLGSIHPNEFTKVADQDDCLEKIRKQELFYPNHLGFMGTAMLINKLRPKYVFLSEFGEELHGFLPDLMKLMKDCINKLMVHDAPKAFLPMDLLFCCDLLEETIYSQEEEKFIPIADADFAHCPKLDLFHFKSSKPVGRVYQAEHNIARFLEDIEHKRNFFFKKK